jgi:uncharacterized protein (TIGR03000 family)
MLRPRIPILAWLLAAVVLGRGSSAAQAAPQEGHGGGAGHAPAAPVCGPGFRGGFGHGPRFRGYYGYYGYPGWFGVGLGAGFGYGWWAGYPYYPYGYGYPVYVDALPGLPPSACPPTGPVAAQGPTAPGPIRLTDADVLLSIRVPPDATVQINGVPTTQNGPRREFVSSGLAPGRTYTFVVTARWTGPNGQAVELQRRIPVQGGERRNVDFTLPSSPPPNELAPVAGAGR